MEFQTWLPHPLLQPYIRYYTYTELGAKNVWTSSAVAPTGCTAMCVIVGDSPPLFKVQDSNEQLFSFFNVAGQSTYYTPFSFYGEYKVISIIFNPCGAFRLLGIRQTHFTNLSLDFFDIIPAKHRNIQQQLGDCQTPAKTFSFLESFLLQLLLKQKGKNNLNRIAFICQQLMQRSHEPLLLKRICKDEGFSKSSLERNFREFVGIGVKQYHRILRFHNLLLHIKQQASFRHWTEIAYNFGYYDQAHFIKDFKIFYGRTPSEFSTNNELFSNMIQ
jgi:AraC-like DNA-binding protein